MYCHVCGKHNPDHAASCHACGAAFANPYQTPGAYGGPAAAPINNYLVPAIFATMCCCMPFGIVSIVYAAQVNGKLVAGDIEGARQTAANAKMWFWISFGMWMVGFVAYIGLFVLGAVMGALEEQGGNF